jgi:hypothetical protein
MVNENFYEIYFDKVGGESVSILTLESPTEVTATFSNVCKQYVEEHLKTEDTENIMVCETPNICPESIKKNHVLFPFNTWYLVLGQEQESYFTLYHKNKILNQGWVYSSESTKVTTVGRFNIRKIKLSGALLTKINEITDRENYATEQLNEANLKCLHNIQRTLELNHRESDFAIREKEMILNEKNVADYAKDLQMYSQQLDTTKTDLVSWEKDLIKWENFLETKEKDSSKMLDIANIEINCLKTKLADSENVIKEKNKTIELLTSKIIALESTTNVLIDTDSDSDEIYFIPKAPPKEIPKSKTPPSIQQSHIYLDELKQYFADKHWRRLDSDEEKDTSRLDRIEKNIYRTDF